MEDTESTNDDPTVSTLLSMSEYYMAQTPQGIQEAVRCLMAALSLKPPPRIEAKTRLKLGLLFYHHTNNLLEAREQLHQAALVTQSAANLEEVRFEATSVSTRILLEQRSLPQAKSLLRSKLDNSIKYPYWHMRLLLQLADIHVCERDERGVVSVLDRCADYAKQVDASYARLLCMLYKGAFLLTHHRYQEAGEVLNQTSSVIEGYHGDKENLIRTFYLIIQVSHLLMAGQVKTAKPHLKQLQQRVKQLSAETSSSGAESSKSSSTGEPEGGKLTADSIQWLTKEQTFVIVYLVSVMHSVMSGYTEKALTYADKAFQFMNVSQKSDSVGVVSVLRAHLLEHTIVCLLMQGKPASVTDKLEEVVSVCHSHSQLVFSHRAVLHTLLGLYAFALEKQDRAISQFHTALQHTNNSDLRLFITINLAISYMKEGEKHAKELASLMKNFDSEVSPTSCLSLRAAVHYVKGLYSYTELKLHDAKRHLRETLVMSNKCDLNKLTACSLILLGQIFLSVGNTKETMDMVSPAMQLAQKIPDKKLQVWAATLLADLYHFTGQSDKEVASREQCMSVEKSLLADLTAADQSKHNSLLQWTVGDWPVSKPSPSKVVPTDDGPHPPDISKQTPSSPSHTKAPQHTNMLSQHSSPSTSRKLKSPGHASSHGRPLNYGDTVDSMEVDRTHPVAKPTTPTQSSKRRKSDHKHTSSPAGLGSPTSDSAPLQTPNGGTPNGRKQVPLKNLEIKLDNTRIIRRNSSTLTTPTKGDFPQFPKDTEVNSTKLTTPTGRSLPNPPLPSEGWNPVRPSHRQVGQDQPVKRDQQGMELNTPWMDMVTASQSKDQNFLPSFDSDMAFQQLSPSLHRRQQGFNQEAQRQGQQSNFPHQRQHGFNQEVQQQGQQRESPQHRQHGFNQEAQRQGQQRDSPQLRPPPPPYQQNQVSGSQTPPPSVSAQLQLPSSSSSSLSPRHSSPSSLHYGHQEKQHQLAQSPYAFLQQGRDPLIGQTSPQPLHQKHQRHPSVHTQQQQQQRQQELSERERENAFNRAGQHNVATSSVQQQRRSEQQNSSSSNSGSGVFSPIMSAQLVRTSSEQEIRQQQQQRMMNESLSIPTLHDLHSQQQQHLEQQQRKAADSQLGIPPFHHIHAPKPASMQQQSGNMELGSSQSSQILSSMQIQNPSQLHPGSSVSPRANATPSSVRQPTQYASSSPSSQHSRSPAQASPLQHSMGSVGGQHQQPQHVQIRSSISPLHQQAARRSPHLPTQMQQSPPQALMAHQHIQQQGHGLTAAGLQHEIIQHHQPRHPMQQQHQSPKPHPPPQQQQSVGQVQNQDSVDDNLLRMTPPQSAQFSSPLQHHLSPQKINPFSPQLQQQQAKAVLHQQQQHLLQLHQAQAQRQFLLQQQQQQQQSQGGVLHNHGFLSGSAVPPYFGSAMMNTSNKHLMASHPQFSHPQLAHMSTGLQQMAQGATVAGVGGVPSLSQQQHMGANPYASLGQGLQLLPNGNAALPRASSGFQPPSQSMGSPLRHYHSQGR